MNLTTSKRRGLGLVETLVALALFGLLVVAWHAVLHVLRRGETKMTDRACAMAAAELAASKLSRDVASMLPPDPFQPERCPEVGSEGDRVSFLACERSGRDIVTRRATWSVKRAGKLFEVLRNGRALPGVLFESFAVRLVAGPRGDPRLAVRLVGASGPERHPVELSLPLPPPGPAATIGLPGDAERMLARAVRIGS